MVRPRGGRPHVRGPGESLARCLEAVTHLSGIFHRWLDTIKGYFGADYLICFSHSRDKTFSEGLGFTPDLKWTRGRPRDCKLTHLTQFHKRLQVTFKLVYPHRPVLFFHWVPVSSVRAHAPM